MSARAAAQLEFIGFSKVLHYFRGKADWMVRRLPCEPSVPISEWLRALPFFLNNLTPGIRSAWIRYSRRRVVGESARDDLMRLKPSDPAQTPVTQKGLTAVVLNDHGVLLGAIEGGSTAPAADATRAAFEIMNPAPQTIRPDMTTRLAAALLRTNPHLLVTLARGEYVGRYAPRLNLRFDQ
jgi:hypothetical protein